ncbi:conserved Plasmodium protein, unknown function, partial [Plasmodium ovale curtisi]
NNEIINNINYIKKENIKKNIIIENLKKEINEEKKKNEEFNKDKLLIEKNTEILIEERNYINEEFLKTQKLLENQILKNKDIENIKNNLLEKINLFEKKEKDFFKKNSDYEKKLENIFKKNKILINDTKMKDKDFAKHSCIIKNLTNDNTKIKMKLDQEYFKVKILEKEKKALNIHVKSLTYEIQNVLKITENTKSLFLNQKKDINDLIMEKEHIKKIIEKIQEMVKINTNVVKKEKLSNITLEKDIKKYFEEKNKLCDDINTLTKEKEKLIDDISQYNTKIANHSNEIVTKDNKINTYIKMVNSLKNDLAKEKLLYENVKSEKMNTCKILADTRDKLNNLEEKFKIQTNQLDILKNDNKGIEFKMNNILEEKKNLTILCEKLREQLEKQKNLSEDIKTQLSHNIKIKDHIEIEIKELNIKLKNADKNVTQIKKENDILTNEINEKNDIINSLRDKIKLLQIAHDNMEINNNNQIQEIKHLKKKVNNFVNTNNLTNVSKETLNNTKTELNSLKKELINEQNKVKTLSDELEKPINIHRWRNLEGNDPTSFDLIQKLKNVQKKLIEKTEENVKKNILIQQKTKECEDLHKELTARSKNNNPQDLTLIRQQLREKDTLIKSLTAEISMYQEDPQPKGPLHR